MADNLKYNEPGTGPNVATDDVGSVHYQFFKLDGGANGVAEPITGTTVYGIDVRTKGFVSPGNSSTDTLAADTIFTGVGEEVLHFSAVTINCFANVPSATGGTSGIVLEWSNDNTNWDRQELFYYRIGSMGFSHTTRHKGRYFRLWYRNNSVTAQSSFRLQTIYHAATNLPDSAAINGRVIVDGLSYPIKQLGINATLNGDNTVISSVTNRRIRILSIAFTCSSAVDIAFKSGASVTLINAMSFAKQGGAGINMLPSGLMLDTNIGDAFVMNLSAAVNVRGWVNYVEIP